MKRASLWIVLCLVVAAGVAASAEQQRPPAAGRGQDAVDMKACQDAMARHNQMMKEMATVDTRLQEQVKACSRRKVRPRSMRSAASSPLSWSSGARCTSG